MTPRPEHPREIETRCFLRWVTRTVNAILRNQTFLVVGRLSIGLRKHKFIYGLDTHDDNLRLFCCIVVYQMGRPGRCTQQASLLARQYIGYMRSASKTH